MQTQPQTPSTQIDWLERDLEVYRALVTDHPLLLRPLLDSSAPAEQILKQTVVSLFWACLDYSNGAVVLLRSGYRTPLIPVQRSILEAYAGLRHLLEAESPSEEAVVHRAYVLLRELKWPLEDGARIDRERIVQSLPVPQVDEARRRIGLRRGWTGRTWRDMLAQIGFSSYEIYSYLSEQSHGSAHFDNVAWELAPDGSRQLRLGYRFHPLEMDYAANMTRRFMHAAFHSFWAVLDGPSVTLHTTDPHEWYLANESGDGTS